MDDWADVILTAVALAALAILWWSERQERHR